MRSFSLITGTCFSVSLAAALSGCASSSSSDFGSRNSASHAPVDIHAEAQTLKHLDDEWSVAAKKKAKSRRSARPAAAGARGKAGKSVLTGATKSRSTTKRRAA